MSAERLALYLAIASGLIGALWALGKIVIAVVRFFAHMEGNVTRLTVSVEKLDSTLEHFTEDVRDTLTTHGEKIAAVEARVQRLEDAA